MERNTFSRRQIQQMGLQMIYQTSGTTPKTMETISITMLTPQ